MARYTPNSASSKPELFTLSPLTNPPPGSVAPLVLSLLCCLDAYIGRLQSWELWSPRDVRNGKESSGTQGLTLNVMKYLIKVGWRNFTWRGRLLPIPLGALYAKAFHQFCR